MIGEVPYCSRGIRPRPQPGIPDADKTLSTTSLRKLDMLDHIVDGTPRLERGGDVDRWVEVCTEAYEALCAGIERPPLQPYGATNPGEFFAVATEAFFDVPVALEYHEPRLYEVMRDFYKQDPATRIRR